MGDAIICISLLTWILLVDVASVLILLPRSMLKLIWGYRSETGSGFDERMWDFVDPRRQRKELVPLGFIMLENDIGLIFLWTLVELVCNFWQAPDYWAMYATTLGTRHYALGHLYERELGVQDTIVHFLTLTMWSSPLHGTAIALCF